MDPRIHHFTIGFPNKFGSWIRVSNWKGSGLFCCFILSSSLRMEARYWMRFDVLESESTTKGSLCGGIVSPVEEKRCP
jgi:hypothetical protein